MRVHSTIEAMRLTAILLFLTLLVASCYNDKEILLYPENHCAPPASPSYQTDVAPLLSHYCNFCHSGGFPSGNVILDSYPEVKKYVDNGQLVGTITWASSYSAMPKNGNKLTSCNLGKIKAWVTAGAPNN